jgi:hypothetical protein
MMQFWEVEFNDGSIYKVFANNEEEAMDIAEHEVNEHSIGMMLVPVAVAIAPNKEI